PRFRSGLYPLSRLLRLVVRDDLLMAQQPLAFLPDEVEADRGIGTVTAAHQPIAVAQPEERRGQQRDHLVRQADGPPEIADRPQQRAARAPQRSDFDRIEVAEQPTMPALGVAHE